MSNTEHTTSSNDIHIDLTNFRQTVHSMAGNYAKNRMGIPECLGYPHVMDEMGAILLDKLNPNTARVGIPFNVWEEEPGVFNKNGYVTNTFLLMQMLAARSISMTGSIWAIPFWMMENPPENQSHTELNRILRPDKYSVFAKSLLAFLVEARDKYGVGFDYLSFNEPDWGGYVFLEAEEYAKIVAICGEMFAQHGFTPKWLVGDTAYLATTHNWRISKELYVPDYMKTILACPKANPYLGPVAFHNWDYSYTNANDYEKLYQVAAKYGRDVWCTEANHQGVESGTHESVLDSWDYIMSLVDSYYRMLHFARANVLQYWQYNADFPLLNSSDMTPLRRYFVIEAYTFAFPPGSRVVAVETNNSNINLVGGVCDRRFSAILVNLSESDESVALRGLPDGGYTWRSFTEAEPGGVEVPVQASDGFMTLALPARSYHRITGDCRRD